MAFIPNLREVFTGQDGRLTVPGLKLLSQMFEDVEALKAGEYDMDIAQAERVVKSTYDKTVSVKEKAKNLGKFGFNGTVGTTWETVGEFQGATANETFAVGNTVDQISSSSASDAGKTFNYEGHTVDSVTGVTAFISTSVTLDGSDGRTPVNLPIAIGRANRLALADSGTPFAPQSDPVGDIYVFDSTLAAGVTGGVPNTATATKLMITAGNTQSQKGATTISSSDFWFLSSLEVWIAGASPTANVLFFRTMKRDLENGGAWRPGGASGAITIGQTVPSKPYRPFLIIPSGHDFRIQARTDTGTAAVSGEADGYLAAIQ